MKSLDLASFDLLEQMMSRLPERTSVSQCEMILAADGRTVSVRLFHTGDDPPLATAFILPPGMPFDRDALADRLHESLCSTCGTIH